MDFPAKISRIDELWLGDYHYLTENDHCYHILEYFPRKGYGHSDANNLIQNFKKPINRKNNREWRFRENAVAEFGHELARYFLPEFLRNATFVPIPPSKTKNDSEYNPRLMETLKIFSEQVFSKHNISLDIKELVVQTVNTETSHETGNRLTPDNLRDIYEIEHELLKNTKNKICLFDDVLTTGAHFRAMKTILAQHLPQHKIIGLFLARSVREPMGAGRS